MSRVHENNDTKSEEEEEEKEEIERAVKASMELALVQCLIGYITLWRNLNSASELACYRQDGLPSKPHSPRPPPSLPIALRDHVCRGIACGSASI